MMLDLGREFNAGVPGLVAHPAKDDLKNRVAVFVSNLCELNPGSLARAVVANACYGLHERKMLGRAKTHFKFSVRQQRTGNFQKKPAASKHHDVGGEASLSRNTFSRNINTSPRISPECGLTRIGRREADIKFSV